MSAHSSPKPESEPAAAAAETAPMPYLKPTGELVIPFNSDSKYHWWKKGGQRRDITLAELTQPATE